MPGRGESLCLPEAAGLTGELLLSGILAARGREDGTSVKGMGGGRSRDHLSPGGFAGSTGIGSDTVCPAERRFCDGTVIPGVPGDFNGFCSGLFAFQAGESSDAVLEAGRWSGDGTIIPGMPGGFDGFRSGCFALQAGESSDAVLEAGRWSRDGAFIPAMLMGSGIVLRESYGDGGLGSQVGSIQAEEDFPLFLAGGR